MNKGCNVEIVRGWSGYCLCDDGRKAMPVGCRNKRHFTCRRACNLLGSYHKEACVGWRATDNCHLNGPRDMHADKDCHAHIQPTDSGWCECTGGRKVKHVSCENPNQRCVRAHVDVMSGHVLT